MPTPMKRSLPLELLETASGSTAASLSNASLTTNLNFFQAIRSPACRAAVVRYGQIAFMLSVQFRAAGADADCGTAVPVPSSRAPE